MMLYKEIMMAEILGLDDDLLNAALALDVYRDLDRPPLPAGWQIYLDCPLELQIDGYFGAAYYSMYSFEKNSMAVNVVIAHRGTVNKEGGLEDLEMYFLHKVPAQFNNAALPFIQQVLEKIDVDFPSFKKGIFYVTAWAFTGHSLGGTLAELSTAYCASQPFYKYLVKYPNNSLDSNLTYCHSFESPGSVELLNVLSNQGIVDQEGIQWLQEAVNCIFSDINAINTALTHIGDFFMSVSVGYEWLPNATGKLPLEPDVIYYVEQYTIQDQHHMKKLYNAIKNDNVFEILEEWPAGADAGLTSYMQYQASLNGFHYQWWDGYMQLLWEQYPELATEYTYADGSPGNYDAFTYAYIQEYLSGNQNKSIYLNRTAHDNSNVGQYLLPSSFLSGHRQPNHYKKRQDVENNKSALALTP